MVEKKLASATNGWLLDGYPRSLSQAEALENMNIRPHLFILLEASVITSQFLLLLYATICHGLHFEVSDIPCCNLRLAMFSTTYCCH